LQVLIITNGDLGPDMPFARGEPLGSGAFHVFLVRDLGLRRLVGQLRRTWSGAVLEHPARWGFQAVRVKDVLTLRIEGGGAFPLNVDGSTLACHGTATVRRRGQIRLFRRGNPDV
jgi:diacylglycerol kinase family enzyme